MTTLDPAMEAAYRAAEYVIYVDDEAIVTRIDQSNGHLAQLLTMRGARSAVLLTACNPRSRPLPIAQNFARQQLLNDELKRMGIDWLSAVGRSADGLWHEVSMLAFDLSPAQAQYLCRKFEQHSWVNYDSEGCGDLIATDLSGVPISPIEPDPGRSP